MNKIKNIYKLLLSHKFLVASLIILLLITYLYFSVSIAVFPDSVQYYGYLKILKGVEPISSWGLVRGPSFPLVLYTFILVFKDAMIAILIGSYLFFMVLISACYYMIRKIAKSIKSNNTTTILACIIFLITIVFNPILFGYFHTVLTEFVATLMSFLSCVLSWVWLKTNINKNKIKFFIYSFLIILSFVFMWFLKQPYITIALFPPIIAVIISIIQNHKISNILSRSAVIILSVITLFIAIIGWKSFLINNGTNINNTNNVDNNYLAGSILKGVSDTRFEKKDNISTENINIDKILTKQEKELLITAISNGKNVNILIVFSPTGKLIDKIPIIQNSEKLSVNEALNTWLQLAIYHPLVVTDSYIANYLAATDFYNYTGDPQNGALIPTKKLAANGHENHAIGMWYVYHTANMDDWVKEQMNYPESLKYVKNEDSVLIKAVFGTLYPISEILYMILYLFLPLLLVLTIILYRKLRKSNRKVNEQKLYAYSFVLILFGFSLMHVLFHVVMGAIIDRYIFVTYPCVVIGVIILLLTNFQATIKIDRTFNK